MGPGSSEGDIKEVQTILKRLNYPVGRVDGVYGRLTRGAVLLIQDDLELPRTGVVDDETFRRMRVAPERPMGSERAAADAGTLRKLNSKTILNLDGARIIAFVLAILSGGGLTGIGTDLENYRWNATGNGAPAAKPAATATTDPVGQIVEGVARIAGSIIPGADIGAGLTLIGSLAGLLFANNAVNSRVQDHRKGRNLGK